MKKQQKLYNLHIDYITVWLELRYSIGANTVWLKCRGFCDKTGPIPTVWVFHVVKHQQNVNRSGSNTQSSQTLRVTSPVLPSTSRCFQTPLELSNVLSDSARAFSGAPESTCSYGGAFRKLRDLTYRIVKFQSSWDLCADLREASRAAQTTAQHCGRHVAVFSQQWFLHNHKEFHITIFVFVTVTKFATS